MDPSLHAGQAHSLAVIRAVEPWLRQDANRRLEFVYVPSKLGWGIHKEAHESLRALPRIPGNEFETSIGQTHKWVDEVVDEIWGEMMQDPSHRGRQFLELADKLPTGRRARREAKPLKPSSKKHGTWLTPVATRSNAFIARYTRAILNHAPIGSYRERFRIGDTTNVNCPCGRKETREHILDGGLWTTCTRYSRRSGRYDEFHVV